MVDSTYNWYWLVDGLRGQGCNVRLANPAKMVQYQSLKASDDASDAGWLAEQLPLGILPESYVYPAQVRPLRDALRRRMLILRQRTQLLLSLESMFARCGLACPTVAELKGWSRSYVEALKLDAFTQLQVESLLELVRKQDVWAQGIECAVLKAVKPTDEFRRIQQVPRIGPILGLVVVLESGEFGRLASAGHYASYCRKVKSERRSNDKKKGQNNPECFRGNRYLAWAYAEAAVQRAGGDERAGLQAGQDGLARNAGQRF